MIKGGWKSPKELPTTRVLMQYHIIKSFPLQEEVTYMLPRQTQDSSTQMSSAILMPSSNALQVVLIWIILLTSCGVHQMKSINISNSITSLDLRLVPWSVVEWMLLIPASLFIFTKNVMKISTQMKVHGMTTALNNEYIFKMYFWLTNSSTCQTSEDAHEYLMRLRKCLLEELPPLSDLSNVTENGLTYDEHIHSSMRTFWDLFSTGIYAQKLHAKDATRFLQLKTFSKLMLKFLQSLHESDHACTLEELISHHNAPEGILEYWCNECDMRTCARWHSIISQYPKVLCIVLSHKKSNDTIIKSAVQYPLRGLFGTVHHKASRGKSGHYIAICEHQDSNNWFSYYDERVYHVRLVNRINGNVLTDFLKSAAILFYVNYTAVLVHSNDLCTRNGNNETQSLVDTDNDVFSSPWTVSSSSSKQRQSKSTNETAQTASICMQTQHDSSNNPVPPKLKWCDWAMGSFSHTGHDTPHQEQCIGHGMKMATCHHIGCSTKVHRLCHIDWLTRHWYEPPPQHFCRQHSNCYQLWRRFRANIIPHSENGCIPGSELAAG